MNCFGEQWQNVTTLCLKEKSLNPIEIMCKLMDLEFCNMKGCEHSLMASAALLTAYLNAVNRQNSDKENLDNAMNLSKALQRLETLEEFKLGADCDYWGACEIIRSSRAFWAVISDRDDLADKLVMDVSNAVGSVGGPRCCKRSAYLAISKIVEFVKNHLGVKMELTKFFCKYSSQNCACLLEDCPYNENFIEY